MRRLALALLLALAACGSGGEKAPSPPSPSPSAVAADAGSLCNGLPDFVALVRAEAVSTCARGETQPGHMSGTVAYITRDAPDAVIAFYKAKVEQAGIPVDVIEPSADGTMLLARDGKGRSLMAHAAASRSGGSDVTVNWGYDK